MIKDGPWVFKRKDETTEELINRFLTRYIASGIYKEMKRKNHFRKKSDIKREKIQKCIRRLRRNENANNGCSTNYRRWKHSDRPTGVNKNNRNDGQRTT